MKASTDLLSRVNQILTRLGTNGEPLDDTSRQILFQIAQNQGNGKTTTVSDVTRTNEYGTAPTVYTRLKKLLELDLIVSSPNPTDGRSNHLRLTNRSVRMLKASADAIRKASEVNN